MREETWIWRHQPQPDLPPAVPSPLPPATQAGRPLHPAAALLAQGGPNGEIFDLFVEFFSKKQPLGLKGLIDELEKRIIVTVLGRVHGNQKEAARALGLKYTTLNEKVKKYGIHFRRKAVPFSD
jgi:DNA-binding NtrC family response regulator